MELLLYVLSVCFGIAALVPMIAGFRSALRARRVFRDIDWVTAEHRRALVMLQSSDKDEVLLGLQLVSALYDPKAEADALVRVARLIKSDDKRVSTRAEDALEVIASRAVPPKSADYGETKRVVGF